MTITGFYVISDKFFDDFPDPYLKGNKAEARPHYYCLEGDDGLFWVIPMSKRHQKYKVTSEVLSRQIKNKAKTVLGLLRRGIKFSQTQPDVFAIERELLSRRARS